MMRTPRVAVLLAVLVAASPAPGPVVRVIAFNDFHGNLTSPGSFAGKPAGGADFLSAYVAHLESENPRSVVVAAGDLIGASPLVSGIFHDEGTIEVMNRLGLELSSVGNHEFDDGRVELLRLQAGGCNTFDRATSCQGAKVGTRAPFEGARFQYLAANVVDAASGKTLLPPYAIKRFTDAGGRAFGVAFIGMTLAETPTIVTPAGVAGLRFDDEAATVNALVPELRAQGIEAIVVLIHQGAGAALTDVNGCAPDGAGLEPIRGIVARLDNAVDLVVSGHTHLAYVCRMANRAGRPIPVTQAGAQGRVVTTIDLTLDDATGDVLQAVPMNHVVDRTDPSIAPDAVVASIVEGYRSLVAGVADRVVGAVARDVAASGDEMPLGDLIADAQLAATRAPASDPARLAAARSPAPGGAQIALMNRGGVRAPGFVFDMISGGEKSGEITYAEAFAVQPFGNTLQTVTLTARQLKEALEQEFGGCAIPGEPAQATDRMLQVSAGFSFAWDPSVPAATCDRIRQMSLGGVPIYDAALGGFVAPVTAATEYRVTVNNFMADGGDGYTVLRQGKDPVGGGVDADALVAYLEGFKAPGAPYDPDAPGLGKPRVRRVGPMEGR